MPENIDSKAIRFSVGNKTNLAKVENRTLPWGTFSKKFETVPRSGETQAQFNKLTDEEQKRKKAAEGFWFRSATDGNRRNAKSALPSDLISLDFDKTKPEFFATLRDNTLNLPYAYFIHTSRNHTPEKPRFRMVIPTATPIPNELYPAASRIVAFRIDPEMIHGDPVGFRPAQMMFMPTASKDGEYVYRLHDGEACDWQAELDIYGKTVADWRDVTKLPKGPGETLRQTAEKAEDPTEKDGPVGWFCRAYDIPEAIDAFDLPYEPVDEQSGKPRYTYTNGTTVNGAEVQDGGLFLYSHHGSDPASDQLLNSFDLVRIHKFGDLDKNFDKDGLDENGKKVTPGKWPSFKAMTELVEKDERYRSARIEAMYDPGGIMADLPDEDAEPDDTDDVIARLVGDPPRDDLLAEMLGETPSRTPETQTTHHLEVTLDEDGKARLAKPRKRSGAPAKGWMNDLDVADKTGAIKNTLPNVQMIFANDPRVRDCFAYNEFTQENVFVHPVKAAAYFQRDVAVEDELSGDLWEDRYNDGLRSILESPPGPPFYGYGMKPSQQDIRAAINIIARGQSFHPLRDAFESVVHDGEARVETLFIDYLGCPDTPYYRDTARNMMIAAVMRTYEPGAKFDFVSVLWGAQGVGKSTFVETMALGFFKTLTANFSDARELQEEISGGLFVEVDELTSMTKSESEAAKSYFSKTEVQIRKPYAENPTLFKRQCVFVGTTNNKDFLKDATGNRRFWPIEVRVKALDKLRLIANLGQIWAETLTLYRAMRAKYPHNSLPLYLTGVSAATAVELQGQALRRGDVDALAEIIELMIQETNRDHYSADLQHVTMITYLDINQAVKEANVHLPSLSNSLSVALDQVGFEAIDRHEGRITVNGKKTKGYVPTGETIARWKKEITDANPGPGVEDDFADLGPDPETLI